MSMKIRITKETWFVIVITVLTTVMFYLPTGHENPSITKAAMHEKALVLKTDNSDLQSFSIVTTGTQEVELLIKTGQFAGDTVHAKNVLLGQKNLDKIFRPGDRVLAVIQPDESGESYAGVRAAEYYRQDVIWVLFGCFALFLLLFSKAAGFRIVLSFIFTAVALWKVLVPLYLSGYSPLWTAMGIVLVCTAITLLLVGGINRKGIIAFLGTAVGIIATAIIAIVFGYLFKIPATIQEYSEALLYTGYSHLNLSDIFIAGIFISSAGVVMDVAMDISASLHELCEHNPQISRKNLTLSGFRIATPVIGTMTTTLLFAYSGSFMFAMMAFMAKGIDMKSIINSGFVAAEILHTLVGSFGLVLVAPLTAIIGGYLYTMKKKS